MIYLRLSKWYGWRFKFSGIWPCLFWWMVPLFSKRFYSCIFKGQVLRPSNPQFQRYFLFLYRACWIYLSILHIIKRFQLEQKSVSFLLVTFFLRISNCKQFSFKPQKNYWAVLITNEMHNSYNQFFIPQFLVCSTCFEEN